MKNKEVVKCFLKQLDAIGSNLTSTGIRLISYNTTIAEWKDGCLIINHTKYSNTSTRHLNMLVKEMSHTQKCKSLYGIPRNVLILKYYVKDEI